MSNGPVLHQRQHGICHVLGGIFTAKVWRARFSRFQYFCNRLLDCIRRFLASKMAHHQYARKDGCKGVGNALSGNIWS